VRAREGRDRPDPARPAQARRDLDDVLRRALHAAVDPVEPAGDGLTRILHRLSTPSAMRQATLLVTDCVDLARLITIWLEPAFTRAMRLRWRQHAGCRRGSPYQATRATARPAGRWLRPALAVASAATIVVIGVVVLGPARQIVTRTGLNGGAGASSGVHSAGGGHGPSPTADLTRTVPTRPRTTSAQAGRTSHQPSCAAASCPASAGTKPSPTLTPSGSPAASPSQSPTPTATPSNNGHHTPHPGKSKPPKGGS
jgi:hypothetical protein